MIKTIKLFLSVLLLPFGAAQAGCPVPPPKNICGNQFLNSDSTAVSCQLGPSGCSVDLDETVKELNGFLAEEGIKFTITDTTPMVIQAWGGNGAGSTGTGHNSGGAGGYAQTVTTVDDYSLQYFSTYLFFFLGNPGKGASGKHSSHCGGGGGASTVVAPIDLSLNPDIRPTLAEVLLVAGGGGGAGAMNFTGTCNLGTSSQGGPGAAGGVAIATTKQAVNAAGVTVLHKDGSCTSNGGGDWNGSGGGGSGGGGATGADGIGSWGGNGGGGSSCSPGATAKWFNSPVDFTAAVDSGGGGNSDTKSCTAGGGGGGGGYGGGGGGRHGNDDSYSCGGGGGGSYAVKATVSGGPQTRPQNIRSPNGTVFLEFLINPSPSPSPIGVAQTLNADSYQKGDLMTVGVSVENVQSPTDFFMGTLLPDGNTMYFVTELLPLTLQQGFLDDPHTFRPLSDREVIPDDVIASLPGLVTHWITGAEPVGNYQFFSALTQPNAFGNGSIDPGDFIALDIDPFTVQGPESE